jgi:hypothetical protein
MPPNEAGSPIQAIAGSDREASVLERLKQKRHPNTMRRVLSRGERRRGEILRRLDRAAESLNPILLVMIMGLVILDLSVFAALELSRLPRY